MCWANDVDVLGKRCRCVGQTLRRDGHNKTTIAQNWPLTIKGSACRRPESACRRPESACRRPESACRRPESACRRPESACRRPESACRRPESACRRPESAWTRTVEAERTQLGWNSWKMVDNVATSHIWRKLLGGITHQLRCDEHKQSKYKQGTVYITIAVRRYTI